ncbi:MAG: hypothetical protein R3F30_12520 [Planctomycetota bacterium]
MTRLLDLPSWHDEIPNSLAGSQLLAKEIVRRNATAGTLRNSRLPQQVVDHMPDGTVDFISKNLALHGYTLAPVDGGGFQVRPNFSGTSTPEQLVEALQADDIIPAEGAVKLADITVQEEGSKESCWERLIGLLWLKGFEVAPRSSSNFRVYKAA